MNTEYGFTWGGIGVTRVASDRSGKFLQVEAARQRLDIHITPSGLIRTGIHKADQSDNTFSVSRAPRKKGGRGK